jgi:hypothetical protein
MKAKDILAEGVYDDLLHPDQKEQMISNPRMLSIELSAWELTKVMREYRSHVDSYGKVKDNAMVSFYSKEEQEEFEKYINSKGIVYKVIGGPT